MFDDMGWPAFDLATGKRHVSVQQPNFSDSRLDHRSDRTCHRCAQTSVVGRKRHHHEIVVKTLRRETKCRGDLRPNAGAFPNHDLPFGGSQSVRIRPRHFAATPKVCNMFFSRLLSLCDGNQKQGRQGTRRTKLRLEGLESRQMLTAVVQTEHEQLLLELVNRARMDPLAEVARNPSISTLNQGLSANQISATPKQPLAAIQELVDAAGAHAQDMLNKDYFSHYSQPIRMTPTQRAAAEGYSGSVGENIAWTGSTGVIDQTQRTLQAHENLFTSPSHRSNLLFDGYEEVGMAVEFGRYNNGTYNFNAVMVAENFGFHSGSPWLTGVAWNDSVVDDDFYSIGESEAGITITVVDATNPNRTFTTTTGSTGGYKVEVPAGTYHVTASGGNLVGPITFDDVRVANENVKLDFDTSTAVAEEPAAPPEIYDDILGFNTGEEFWVGGSNGTTLDTRYYGELPSWPQYSHVLKGDFNGDGLDDVLTRREHNGNLHVATSSGGSNLVDSRWGNHSPRIGWELFVGDFNGDGLDDVMGRADTNGTLWLAQSTGQSFVNSYWGRFDANTEWQDLLVGDYNGDGRDDLAGRAGNGQWWVGISSGSVLVNSRWGGWSTAPEWFDVLVGDFDGDGRDDIAGRMNNRNWWINRSLGDDFEITRWGSFTDTVTWHDATVGDYDGDGRDDIAARANGQWWIAISQGDHFRNEFWAYWTTRVDWHNTSLIDINRDGRDDLIGRASNGQWWAITSTGSRFSSTLAARWSPGSRWHTVMVGNFTA